MNMETKLALMLLYSTLTTCLVILYIIRKMRGK